jgi:hypothetical protein
MGHSLLFDWFARAEGRFWMVSVSYAGAMYAIEITMTVLLLISITGDDAEIAAEKVPN